MIQIHLNVHSDETANRVKQATSMVVQDSKINKDKLPADFVTEPKKIKTNISKKKPLQQLWKAFVDWKPFQNY